METLLVIYHCHSSRLIPNNGLFSFPSLPTSHPLLVSRFVETLLDRTTSEGRLPDPADGTSAVAISNCRTNGGGASLVDEFGKMGGDYEREREREIYW